MRLFLLMLALVVAFAGTVAGEDSDLSKAVVIGSGPKMVMMFTDPDCPFCRKAAEYFESRKDITEYVFFYPLPRHPMAKVKVQYILSQQDKAKAYHEAMSAAWDDMKQLKITEQGIKLQEEHLKISHKYKVNSTPTFVINGRIIVGFEQDKIEEALGK